MSLYDHHLPPVRPFMDLDSPEIVKKGRVSIRENFAGDDLPVVIACKPAGAAEAETDGKVYADVGTFKVVTAEAEEGPKGAKGAKPSQSYVVHLRPYERQYRFDETFGAERAMQFALDYAIAAFGHSYGYIADLQEQPPPGIAQLRGLLIEYGLSKESELPKLRPAKQQTHGGRGQNAMSPDEAEQLGVPMLG